MTMFDWEQYKIQISDYSINRLKREKVSLKFKQFGLVAFNLGLILTGLATAVTGVVTKEPDVVGMGLGMSVAGGLTSLATGEMAEGIVIKKETVEEELGRSR